MTKLRRILFFGSETAVLGVPVVWFLQNARASYVEPLLPAFYFGLLGLLIASVWSHSTERRLAYFGFGTLGLAILWLFTSAVVVE